MQGPSARVIAASGWSFSSVFSFEIIHDPSPRFRFYWWTYEELKSMAEDRKVAIFNWWNELEAVCSEEKKQQETRLYFLELIADYW